MNLEILKKTVPEIVKARRSSRDNGSLKYTNKQKEEAMALARKTSPYQAAKRLGISRSTIEAWLDVRY